MTLLLNSKNVVEPKQPEVVMKRYKSTCKDQKPISTDLQLLSDGHKINGVDDDASRENDGLIYIL